VSAIFRADRQGIDGVLFNPAGFLHAGHALRDCLKSIKAPAIEIHMTNIEKRGYGSITAEAAIGRDRGLRRRFLPSRPRGDGGAPRPEARDSVGRGAKAALQNSRLRFFADIAAQLIIRSHETGIVFVSATRLLCLGQLDAVTKCDRGRVEIRARAEVATSCSSFFRTARGKSSKLRATSTKVARTAVTQCK